MPIFILKYSIYVNSNVFGSWRWNILLYYILSVYIKWLAVAEFGCIMFYVFILRFYNEKQIEKNSQKLQINFEITYKEMASNTLN